MSIHVCKCNHNGNEEYHLRYPGMTEEAAQSLASKINSGALEPIKLENEDKSPDHITEKIFKRTLEQFYENTKVKTKAEKIKALKWYMDVLFVTNCNTEDEELEFLEHAFNKGL